MYYTVGIIDKSYFTQIKDWLPNMLITIVMGVCVYFSVLMIQSPIIQLIVGVVVGFVVYFSLAYIFNLDAKDKFILQVKSLMQRH